MSTQPSEHAMRAVKEIYKWDGQFPEDDARLIDQHAVEPATRELRAQLKEVDEILTDMSWHTDRGLLQRVRAALAKYEEKS